MSEFPRRDVMVGLVGAAAGLLANHVSAQPKPSPASDPKATPSAKPAASGDKKGAGAHPAHALTPAAPIPPALAAIIESTAACQRDGRVCLARCTDHFAAGMNMEQCQRAVMNMLAVTAAMA